MRAVKPLVASFALIGAIPLYSQVPTFSEVSGHDFGERITVHHEMVAYLDALDRTSDRVVVQKVGESWEGRDLVIAIVTSPENHARLAEIRRNARLIGDPRALSDSDFDRMLPNQPAIGWFGGSIHGFELSGAEGILKALEHLTTRSDAATMQVLRNTVLVIDPMLNPDGRDAFAHKNHQSLSIEPNPNRADWNNTFTGWQALQYRTGHYFFDTNRDWFAQTQRETQARVPVMREWRPQIAVDMHEMGSDVEFYFDPATGPWSPLFPPYAREGFEVFNRAYAAAFDSAGYEYMTRERYNYFFPGYSTSYGSYQGAVGMLYEQGSSRGLSITRADESVRRLGDALEQQYLAAWTAMSTLAVNREEFLANYRDGLRNAIEEGRSGTRRYVIPADAGDPGNVRALIETLINNGIEVSRISESVRLSGVSDRAGASVGQRAFEAGAYVVETGQPLNRLVRTLMDPAVEVPAEFLAEARERVDRGESARFYDITAWSLPMLFDVESFATTDGRDLQGTMVESVDRPVVFPSAPPGYAYLIDGSQAGAVAALWHLKDRGYRAAMTYKVTTIGGTEFSSGTVIVRVGQNDDTVGDALREIAEILGVDVRGVDTGLAPGNNPSLGSGDWVITAQPAEVAIVAEDPVQAYSFGWAWYTLSERFRIRTTVLRAQSVDNTDLSQFTTIVLPALSGSQFSNMLGEDGRARLDRWIRDGGTLVTLGSAVSFVVNNMELIDLRSWYSLEENEDERSFSEPGAFLRGMVANHTWMAAGIDKPEVPVLMNSSRIYLPPEGSPSSGQRVVISYADEGPVKLAGHMWPESEERVPGAVFAYEQRVGGGRVISFIEDVNFRAFWRGMHRLFLNAVVVGPSAP